MKVTLLKGHTDTKGPTRVAGEKVTRFKKFKRDEQVL